MANTYNYLNAVIEDVKEWIEYNMDLEHDIITGTFQDRDDIETYLNDTLWTEDSVTGNGSGSYTFNRAEAEEYVTDDTDTVREALKEFCVDAETIAEKFLDGDWKYLDVTARCYVLNWAIAEVLDEIEDEIDAAIEEREEMADQAADNIA